MNLLQRKCKLLPYALRLGETGGPTYYKERVNSFLCFQQPPVSSLALKLGDAEGPMNLLRRRVNSFPYFQQPSISSHGSKMEQSPPHGFKNQIINPFSISSCLALLLFALKQLHLNPQIIVINYINTQYSSRYTWTLHSNKQYFVFSDNWGLLNFLVIDTSLTKQ